MKNEKCNKNFIFRENRERGVALLFSILISSIILAIALGIISISLKEINFNTSAKSTNEAFFAADTGVECALYNDKSSGTTPFSSLGGTVNCISNGSPAILPGPSPWVFVISGLGDSTRSCAEVAVSKVFDALDPSVLISTKIVSRGYDIGYDNSNAKCISPANINSIQRVLEVNY